MTDNAQKHKGPKRWGTGCAFCLVLLPIFYFLTAPLVGALFCWLFREHSIDTTTLLRIYFKPIDFLSGASSHFEDAFIWYWGLFPDEWYWAT